MAFLWPLFFLSMLFADCGNEVDLNVDTVLKDIATLDQDGAGLCYAFTMAQLLEFKFRSEGRPYSPSAVDLSLTTHEGIFIDSDSLVGGNEDDLFKKALAKGVVSKECVEKEVAKYTRQNNLTVAEYVHLLEIASTKFSSLNVPMANKLNIENVLSTDAHLKTCSYLPAVDALYSIGLLGDSVTSILKKVFSFCDEERIKITNTRFNMIKRIQGKKDEDIEQFIEETLDQKKPLVLDLCAEALTDIPVPNYYESAQKSRREEICGRHSVLAVGKRRIKGQCQYLIRNSWGAKWDPVGPRVRAPQKVENIMMPV